MNLRTKWENVGGEGDSGRLSQPPRLKTPLTETLNSLSARGLAAVSVDSEAPHGECEVSVKGSE